MAWTLTISALTRGETTIDVFGAVSVSGDYATGGDGGAAFAYGANPSGFSQFLAESVLHAGQAPISGSVDLGHGYEGKFLFAQPWFTMPALKIYDSSTGAELAAGAYPAALTGATDLQAELRYLKNV